MSKYYFCSIKRKKFPAEIEIDIKMWLNFTPNQPIPCVIYNNTYFNVCGKIPNVLQNLYFDQCMVSGHCETKKTKKITQCDESVTCIITF